MKPASAYREASSAFVTGILGWALPANQQGGPGTLEGVLVKNFSTLRCRLGLHPYAMVTHGRIPRMTQTLREIVSVSERKFTAQEAADALGVTEACIRRWILTRRISSYRVGRLVRISESEVARILREGFVPAREPRQ